MKFTALIERMTTKIVSSTSNGSGSTVMTPSGSEKNCTPLKAITPAATSWPPSLVAGSSS